MAQYRKKPVVIEATQWHPGTEHPGVGTDEVGPYVTTIHGEKAHLADGDWILPEPQPGRFYPCKPDIFEQTYDAVLTEDAETAAA